jgi:hypothetical protein
MKFIYNHPLTGKYLQEWAGKMDLQTANFFFWNSGGALQKSQEGLLRSLLYDVLGKVPELIPILFPAEWAAQFLQQLRLSGGSTVSERCLCTFIDTTTPTRYGPRLY